MTVAGKVFVSLPVKDLHRSRAFFRALGFAAEPRFSDETAACLALGEDKYAMLATEDYFAAFVPGREIVDPRRSAQVVVAFSVGSRQEVDALVDKASSAGGAEYREPMDLGWLYGRAFLDPDGHVWEALHIDKGRMPDDSKASGGPAGG